MRSLLLFHFSLAGEQSEVGLQEPVLQLNSGLDIMRAIFWRTISESCFEDTLLSIPK